MNDVGHLNKLPTVTNQAHSLQVFFLRYIIVFTVEPVLLSAVTFNWKCAKGATFRPWSDSHSIVDVRNDRCTGSLHDVSSLFPPNGLCELEEHLEYAIIEKIYLINFIHLN